MKKLKIKFAEAVNWEWVHANHDLSHDGKVRPNHLWCQTIINHARKNGYKGNITALGACRIINQNLF